MTEKRYRNGPGQTGKLVTWTNGPQKEQFPAWRLQTAHAFVRIAKLMRGDAPSLRQTRADAKQQRQSVNWSINEDNAEILGARLGLATGGFYMIGIISIVNLVATPWLIAAIGAGSLALGVATAYLGASAPNALRNTARVTKSWELKARAASAEQLETAANQLINPSRNKKPGKPGPGQSA